MVGLITGVISLRVGAVASKVLESVLDTIFPLVAASWLVFCGIFTVTTPSAVGMILNVYVVPLTAVNPVLVPFVTTISEFVNHVTASLNIAVTAIGFVFVGSWGAAVIVTVGRVVSIVNPVTLSTEEIFPAASVTRIVQLLWVASLRVLNVIVLFQVTAPVLLELQSPPYVILHASLVLKI